MKFSGRIPVVVPLSHIEIDAAVTPTMAATSF